MKYDLQDVVKDFAGADVVLEGEPMTLKAALLAALMANPIFEEGPASGTPRPLSAAEMTARTVIGSRLGGEAIDLTAAEITAVQTMLRFVRPQFAIAINAHLER